MLKIKLVNMDNMEDWTLTDIEKEFKMIRLSGKDIEKALIKQIEDGTWNDSKSFIDRFGFKLHNSELSTGCKAALVVANTDKLVNLRECGLNALDHIISLCKSGNIEVVDTGVTFRTIDINKDIDVELDGYRFSNTDRLNHYIQSERPFKPDMTKEGIKCL